VGTASDDGDGEREEPSVESSDGDTTAAAKPPAAPPRLGSEEDEEEDRTIRTLDPLVEAERGAPPKRGFSGARPLPPGVAVTSKKKTVVGLGPPSEADAKDDSVTKTAPATTRSDEALLGVPGIVKISTLQEDEDLDETEALTLVAPQAQAKIPSVTEADALDDSVTTQAPAMFGFDSGALPPLVPPAAGRPAEEEDEQPTERREAPGYDEDDSVTAQAPVAAGVPSPIEYEPDLPTAQVGGLAPRRRGDERAAALATDSDLEPITGVEPVLDPPEDPSNETAVMPNAPAKPPPTTSASDSALRVMQPERKSADHANIAVLLPDPEPPRYEPPPNPFAATEIHPQMAPVPPMAPAGVEPKKPNYALVVIVVASVSFAAPILLYLALSRAQAEPAARERAEVVADPIPRADAVRSKKPPPKKK